MKIAILARVCIVIRGQEFPVPFLVEKVGIGLIYKKLNIKRQFLIGL